jgi:hypothetical protein
VEIAILVSALFGIVFLLYREHLKGIFFLLGIGIPLLALEIGSIVLPSVQPRYIFYSLPLMICSSAILCDNLRLNLLKIKNPIFLNVTALIILAAQLPGFISHYAGENSLHLKDAVQFVEDNYQQGDQMVIASRYIAYYFENIGPIDLLKGPSQHETTRWKDQLQATLDVRHRTWIILDAYRKPLGKALEKWLTKHAQLVWRKSQKRYDYTVRGYQIFLVNGSETES